MFRDVVTEVGMLGTISSYTDYNRVAYQMKVHEKGNTVQHLQHRKPWRHVEGQGRIGVLMVVCSSI